MAFKMKFSGGKTPFMFKGEDPTKDPVTEEKPKAKETKFVDTPEGRIAVERVTTIPGSERKTYEEVGVSPEEGKAYWEANPEKYQEYLKSKQPQEIVEKRDVDVSLRKTPSVFKPGKFYGLTLSKDIGDEMPMKNIQGIFQKAMQKNKGNKDIQDAIKRDFNLYLEEAGYVTTPTTESKTKIGGWYASN